MWFKLALIMWIWVQFSSQMAPYCTIWLFKFSRAAAVRGGHPPSPLGHVPQPLCGTGAGWCAIWLLKLFSKVPARDLCNMSMWSRCESSNKIYFRFFISRWCIPKIMSPPLPPDWGGGDILFLVPPSPASFLVNMITFEVFWILSSNLNHILIT